MHTVTLLDDPRRFACREGTHVLDALAAVHGEKIVAGCHGGGCGVCRIRVARGTFVARSMNAGHVSAEDVARGVTLACRTFPTSDITVEVLGKRRFAPSPKLRWRA